MASVELVRLTRDAPMEKVIQALNTLTDLALGNDGAQVKLYGYDGTARDTATGATLSTGNFTLDILNTGGKHIRVRNSADTVDLFKVEDGNISFGTVTIDELIVLHDATLGSDQFDDLLVNATSAFASPATFNGTAAFVSTATFAAQATFNGTLEANSQVFLGNADTDAIKLTGLTTFQNAAGSAVQMEVDAANNRVIVGSATPMGSDITPALHVAGRLYVGPDSANDEAILIRRSAASTNQFSLGLTSAETLVIKDITGSEIVEVDSAGVNVTGDIVVSDEGEFGGGIMVTGGMIRLENNLGVYGEETGTIPRRMMAVNGSNVLVIGDPNIGASFAYGAKPIITGSRGGIAALADLLTEGATLGLWTDSSTP